MTVPSGQSSIRAISLYVNPSTSDRIKMRRKPFHRLLDLLPRHLAEQAVLRASPASMEASSTQDSPPVSGSLLETLARLWVIERSRLMNAFFRILNSQARQFVPRSY